MNAPLRVEQLLPDLDRTHLDWLEEEAIFILRETAAAFERPALLFSGGKDSCVVLHLAEKAFKRRGAEGRLHGRLPFPLLHVDTGHNFPEVIDFRDRHVAAIGERLVVGHLDDSIARGTVRLAHALESRNVHQSVTLLEAVGAHRFDALIGGARRDEEKARAKERFFSFRDAFGQWDPKNQRPEIWNLYNARVNQGENMRVFPLSNWTEMDVWEYIKKEKLEVPSIYFSHERECFRRNGQWLPVPPPHIDTTKPDPYAGARPTAKDPIKKMVCRVRTIADMISTGMIDSPASTVDDIIAEVAAARVTERGTRADDKTSEAAMEDRKKAGYF